MSVREKPIIFSSPMVRAILEGRKTQTRRVIKPERVFRSLSPYTEGQFDERGNFSYRSASNVTGMICLQDPNIAKQWCHYSRCDKYNEPFGRLWVRESWAVRLDQDHISPRDLPSKHLNSVGYWADGPGKCCNTGCAGAAGKIRPSIFMPRWASRILLEITNIRVERLQEISEEDAIAEGIDGPLCAQYATHAPSRHHLLPVSVHAFFGLFESINGPGSWDTNPFVWVISFKKIET